MFLMKRILLFAVFLFNISVGTTNISITLNDPNEDGIITSASVQLRYPTNIDAKQSFWTTATHVLKILKCNQRCISWNQSIKDHTKCILAKCRSIVGDFYLFTGKNKVKPIKLDNDTPESVFDRKKKVIFLVHGLNSHYWVHWVNHTRDVFIEFHDFNVIAFDWRTNVDKPLIASQFGMVAMVEMYGEMIRNVIHRLIRNGWKSSNIYLVGHSAGAHIVACAAKYLRDKDGVLLDRITGLDPVGLVFDITTASSRIDKGDAKFVDCIFTSAPFVGLKDPVCAANFYPNHFGTIQPGVERGLYDKIHSHKRAPHLYAESALPGHKFYAQYCDKLPLEKVEPTHCQQNATALMGYPASPKLRGIFFLKTNSTYPFALDVRENEEDRNKSDTIMKEFH